MLLADSTPFDHPGKALFFSAAVRTFKHGLCKCIGRLPAHGQVCIIMCYACTPVGRLPYFSF